MNAAQRGIPSQPMHRPALVSASTPASLDQGRGLHPVARPLRIAPGERVVRPREHLHPKTGHLHPKLDTSARKLDTFLQKLDTSAPELNTLADRREQLRAAAYRPRRTLRRREPTCSPHRHHAPTATGRPPWNRPTPRPAREPSAPSTVNHQTHPTTTRRSPPVSPCRLPTDAELDASIQTVYTRHNLTAHRISDARSPPTAAPRCPSPGNPVPHPNPPAAPAPYLAPLSAPAAIPPPAPHNRRRSARQQRRSFQVPPPKNRQISHPPAGQPLKGLPGRRVRVPQ